MNVVRNKISKERIMITYINYKNLKDDDLDEDFRNFCLNNGFTEDDRVSVVKARSITGHDAYLVDKERNFTSDNNDCTATAEIQPSPKSDKSDF